MRRTPTLLTLLLLAGPAAADPCRPPESGLPGVRVPVPASCREARQGPAPVAKEPSRQGTTFRVSPDTTVTINGRVRAEGEVRR